MAQGSESERPPALETADRDALIAECAEEIDELLAEMPPDWHASGVVETALYTTAVQAAIDGGFSKEDFLKLLGEMYVECEEMTEFEGVMSPNWGDA